MIIIKFKLSKKNSHLFNKVRLNWDLLGHIFTLLVNAEYTVRKIKRFNITIELKETDWSYTWLLKDPYTNKTIGGKRLFIGIKKSKAYNMTRREYIISGLLHEFRHFIQAHIQKINVDELDTGNTGRDYWKNPHEKDCRKYERNVKFVLELYNKLNK